jgi:hypothetical protein
VYIICRAADDQRDQQRGRQGEARLR